MRSGERKVYRVVELNRLIKTVLEDDIGSVWLEGEISNLSRPASGHLYFSLKDEKSEISAVLFRGNQMGLNVNRGSRRARAASRAATSGGGWNSNRCGWRNRLVE
ncbi:MAG: exodeoxyribonuclease VII large subunit, partial [Verrucomicrobiota bacterium]